MSAPLEHLMELARSFFTSGKVFNVLGIIFGIMMIVYGVLSLLLSHFHAVVIGMWLIFFGLVEVLTELRYIQLIHTWFRFMTVFVGKSAFFLFFSTIIMSGNTWHHIFIGMCMLVLAIFYAIAHFCYHTRETTHLLGGSQPMANTSSSTVPPPQNV